jgi:hypothetical protein
MKCAVLKCELEQVSVRQTYYRADTYLRKMDVWNGCTCNEEP